MLSLELGDSLMRREGYPVQYRMANVIPGFYPLNSSSKQLTISLGNFFLIILIIMVEIGLHGVTNSRIMSVKGWLDKHLKGREHLARGDLPHRSLCGLMGSDCPRVQTLDSRVARSLLHPSSLMSAGTLVIASPRDRLYQYRTRAKKLYKTQNNNKSPIGVGSGAWVYPHLQITDKFWRVQMTARQREIGGSPAGPLRSGPHC